MNKLLYSSILKHKFLFVVSVFLISFILLLVPQYMMISRSAELFGMFSGDFIASVWHFSTIAIGAMSITQQILFVGTVLLIAINIVLFKTYLKVYRKLLSSNSGRLSSVALVLTVLSSGCLSCGVLILAPLMSVVGVSSVIWITNNVIIIQLIALCLVGFSNYLLLKKLSDPKVCDISYE